MTAVAHRYPSTPEIKRLVRAARACDIDVAGYEVSPDGTIRIVEARAIPKAPADAFEEARAKGLI